ncbi:MAG: tRNA 5-methoxyuridine(34)/uridine 5-oxyacetic acid(34) synthase CmoB [Gammaproteobacteria bacterium]|nr:MAG: tRNA 5-methoxyuridine(34)/uridine 5-oxyacetic acid(34) synthase CmoB [Gammaproteobacteria bacterium]
MIEFEAFFDHISRTRLGHWAADFEAAIDKALQPGRHGDMGRWMEGLNRLPDIAIDTINLNSDRVTAGDHTSCDDATREQLKSALMQLHPWRKGPFEIAGLHIDTEWRSDWKWRRLAPHIANLKHRKVLDVGCGSGYHLWRMVGAGAGMVIGIDPSQLFLCQFLALQKYLGQHPAYLLPIGIENMPKQMRAFDTVFSMGVLYHRKSPMEHLLELRDLLRPGGELVLETIVVDGPPGYSLVPKGRYGRMGNVWFLPSPPTMEHWMAKCGLKNVRMVDIGPTRVTEQRATEWMTFQSLKDFLDPNDETQTIEGYPAPVRAVFVAEAP